MSGPPTVADDFVRGVKIYFWTMVIDAHTAFTRDIMAAVYFLAGIALGPLLVIILVASRNMQDSAIEFVLETHAETVPIFVGRALLKLRGEGTEP